MPENKYANEYSEDSFWHKTKKFAKTAGQGVLEPAVIMYYAARDPQTPVWAKTTIYGALGYFVSTIDVIPDITPMVGYSDDLAVLIAATAAVAAHIKDVHREKAAQTLKQWFE